MTISLDKTCFKCFNCSKRLEIGAQAEHKENAYCKTCHSRLFGPKGYGFGLAAEVLPETGFEKDGSKKDYVINRKDKTDQGSQVAN
jgi:DNA-directed RNA polymerase subunit RPC12/RpoP